MWITIPLILALQYFGAEKDIFPIERNTKSFMIALIILVFALPCLTYGLGSLGYLIGKLSVRYGVHARNEDSEANHSGKTKLPQ
jgi:hypothetical protein